MHNFIRITTLVVVLIGTAAPVTAATQSEFYAGLLRRGVASYEAKRFPDAARQLRIAAFGLVDTIDQYQLAQIYLTLTHDKLGEADRAREAARRVVIAERVERKYAAVPVPPAVRSAFEALAGRLLTPTEVATLRGGGTSAPPISRPATTPPRSTANKPQTSPAPRGTTTAPQTTAPRTSASTTPPASQRPQPQATLPAPRATTPENTAPQTSTPVPQPQKPKPEPPAPKPIKPPSPATTIATTTATTSTANTTPSATPTKATAQPQRPATPAPTKAGGAGADGRGGPVEAVRPPVPAPVPRPLSASEITARLTAAERALNGANLSEARRLYFELLAAPGLDHNGSIRVAEGLYRARSFAAALTAFNRVGSLRRGEEPYRYYIAVAAYETGDFARAKKELAVALPYIEITADVARYRTRIEGSP